MWQVSSLSDKQTIYVVDMLATKDEELAIDEELGRLVDGSFAQRSSRRCTANIVNTEI